MRILHLTNKPVFPLVDGGCVAMYRFAELLDSPENEVRSLSISTPKHPFDISAYPKVFRERFQPEAIFIDTSVRITGAIQHLLNGRSYNLSRFRSQAFAEKLSGLLQAEPFDLIICESLFLLPYLGEMRQHSNARIMVRTHNVEYTIWEGLASEAGFPTSWYLRKLAATLKIEEIELLNQVDGIAAISEQDAQTFRADGIKVPMQVIPVTIPLTETGDNRSNHFHHIGAMNWKPNEDAVQHLLEVIFPEIRKALPEAQLHLAGSFFPDHITSDPTKGIVVHGFADNATQFVQEHGIQLIPLKAGSGVRIKLLESLASGVPVVTTPVGAGGLPDEVHECLRIAQNDKSFVKHAVELAKNPDLRAHLGQKAQAFVASHYGRDTVKKLMFEFIDSIS